MGRAEPSVGDVLNTDLDEFVAFACDGKLTAEEFNTFLNVLLEERKRLDVRVLHYIACKMQPSNLCM